MAIEDIPGGAATQVAEVSGNPSAVGLSGARYHQAQVAQIPQEPIPVYDSANYPEYDPGAEGRSVEEPQPEQQIAPKSNIEDDLPPLVPRPGADLSGIDPSTVETSTYDVKLPDGQVASITVPTIWGENEVKEFLIDKGVKGLEEKEGDMALQRFVYEFNKGDNITTNVGDYMKSAFPYLSTEYRWGEDGVEIIGPEEIYGEDFYDLTRQERRDRMKEVDRTRLDDKYKEAIAVQRLMEARGESDIAGTAGMISKGIADPAAFVPIAGQAGKIGSAGYKAATAKGAGVGAGWGAAYGVSEQLSESGAPTTKEEYLQMSEKAGKYAATGAIGGAVLAPAMRGTVQGAKALQRVGIEKSLSTAPGRVDLTRKYYQKVWEYQQDGKTSSEATTAARKALKLRVDDVFHLIRNNDNPLMNPAMNALEATRRMAAHANKTFTKALPAKNKSISAFDRYLAPLDSVMREIEPWVAQRVRMADANVLRKNHEYHEGVKGFYKMYDKVPKAERRVIDTALRNNDLTGARELFVTGRGVKAGESFDEMVATLEKLGMEMEKVGIKFDGIQDYFPRQVKDLDGLKRYLGSKRKAVGWRKVLKTAQRNAGRELTEAEQSKLLNRYVTSGRKTTHKDVGSTKKRNILYVDEEMGRYYGDAKSSMDMHIRESTSAIERYNLFGSKHSVDDAGLENLDKSIGDWLVENRISHENIDRLAPLMKSRFGKGEQSGYGFLASARTFIGGVTLGNPYSAIRQLGDNFTAAWQFGIIPTMKSMPRAAWETVKVQAGIPSDAKISADAFGYMNEMAQELDTGGVASTMIKRSANQLYKWGGFKTIDRFGKNVLMGSAIRVAQKSQATLKSRQKFRAKYERNYDAQEMTQLMDDLKAGRMSNIVKAHISAEVMNIQPISRSQMPQAYLDHPNGRMMYQFRTWGVKQFDLARRQIFRNLFSKDPRKVADGARGLVLFTGYVGIGNVGITELQRVFTGRDTKIDDMLEFGNETFGQILGNFAINRYGLDKMAGEGSVEEFFAGLVPPALEIPATMGVSLMKMGEAQMASESEEFDKWSVELLKTTGLGRLANLWFFGGAEEENEKIYNEARKNMGLSQ